MERQQPEMGTQPEVQIFVAIVLPNNYVLIEPMRDHLKVCNSQGDRFLNY